MSCSEGVPAKRRRGLSPLIAAMLGMAVALAANLLRVDAQTPSAAARDGGKAIETDVAPASVKVEGYGPAMRLIHRFGAQGFVRGPRHH